MADEPITLESLPTVDELTGNPEFKALPLEDKRYNLERYFTDASKVDPSIKDVAPLVMQVTSLEHMADRETPIRAERIKAEIPAYVTAFQSAREGVPREEVVKNFEAQLQSAAKTEQEAEYKRETDLQLATEYEGLTKGFSNSVRQFFDESSNALDSLGADAPVTSRRQDIEQLSGRTPEQLQALAAENKIIRGEADGPAGVDSQGQIHFNTNQLLTNKDGVRKFVEGISGVPENSKNRALDSLDSTYDQTVAQTATRLANVPLGEDLSAKIFTEFDSGIPLSDVIFDRARKLQDTRPTQRGQEITDENMATARSEVLKDVIKSEEGRNWFTRGLTEARLDLRGLNQSIDQVARASGVSLEPPFLDTVPFDPGIPDIVTGQVTTKLDLQRQTVNMGRQLDDPGLAATFGEGLVRILPQILITRGVGAGAGVATGLSASAFGASAGTAANLATRAATTAAVGFGGLQSAAGAIEQARNNGVSEEGQLTAGMLGFLTTVGITAGFSAIGRGGVEDFTHKVVSSRPEFVKALTRAGLGEAGEETADQILNAFTSGAIANPDADIRDIAMEGIQAGLYGFIFGAGTDFTQIKIAPRNAPTANQTTEELKQRADAILQVDTLLPNIPSGVDLTEGQQRLADILNVDSPTTPNTNETTNTPQAEGSDPPESPPAEAQSPDLQVDSGDRSSNFGETQTDSGTEAVTPSVPTDLQSSIVPLISSDNVTSPQTSPATADEPSVQLRTEDATPPTTPDSVSPASEPTGGVSDAPVEAPVAGTEPAVRELTQKDVERVNRLAEATSTDSAVRENARNRMTDELLKNPEVSDAVLRLAGRQSASSRADLSASEKRARSEGRVASLQAGENATLEDTLPAAAATPDVEVDVADRAAKTREAIARLTPIQQAAINGQLEGKSDKEIAAESGTTIGSVRDARSKGQTRLRNDPTLAEAVDSKAYAPRTEPTSAESDQRAVDRLRNRWSLVPKLQALSRKIKVASLNPEQAKRFKDAKKIGQFLNVQVVPVEGLPGKYNGLYNQGVEGTVYVSSSSDRPEFMVTIHEALHNFANTNQSGYDRLLMEVSPDLDAFIKSRGITGLSDKQVAEEFIADFMADRLTDAKFVNSLAEKNPSVFREFATLLRSLIAKLINGRQGTERFVKDLQRADAALADALTQLRLRQNFEGSSGETLFETKNPQTNGEINPELSYTPTSLTESTQVLERNYFNWRETPTDANGIRETEKFLVDLLRPEFVKDFQQRLLDTVDSINDYNKTAIAPAISQVAIYNYIAKLGEVDKKESLRLLAMARRITGGIRGFTDGSIDASLAGTYLRALQDASGGGSIAALFETEFLGREQFLGSKFDKETLRLIRDADFTPPSTIQDDSRISDEQREANSRLRDSVDTALFAASPEVEAYVKEVEKRGFDILRRVDAILDALFNENKAETKRERFKRLLQSEENLSEAFDLAGELLGEVESTPRIRALMDDAREAKTEATRRRERATGRSKTTNPVDIHAKRLIGVVSRFDNERKTTSDDTKKGFDALVAKDLTSSEFSDEYVKLGGSAEVASDLYDAVQIRKGRQDAVRSARESKKVPETEERARKSRDAVLGSIQAQVDALGAKASEGRRPTSANDTFAKAFNRFVNLSTASLDPSTFEQQLREFVGKNGELVLTETQVQEISGKAIAARQEALAARSAKLEFDRAQAEAAAERRIFGRELGRAERLFETPQQRDRASKSLNTLISEEATTNPSRSLVSETERLAFAVEVMTASGLSPEAAMERAQSMVANPAKSFVVAGKRSLRQIIEEEIINNPSRRVQTEAQQIEFAENVLRELTDLDPKDIPGVSRRMMQDVTNRTQEAITRAVQPFLKGLVSGKLTEDQISKAIRLQALDPSKDFLTSVAALSGWEGLKDSESSQLLEWERQIGLVQKDGAAAVALYNRQYKLILAASGLGVDAKKLISSFAVARMFSGIRTQALGIWALGNEMTDLTLRSNLTSIVSNINDPAQGVRELTQFHIGAWRSFSAAAAAFKFTIREGVSPVRQIQAGQESKASTLYVDPLTRTYDLASRKLSAVMAEIQSDPNKNRSPQFWQRSKLLFLKYGVASSRFFLRNMSAIDSFATTLHSEAKTNFMQLRAAKDAGITSEKFDALWQTAREQQSNFESFLKNEVGLTDPNIIRLEVFNRIQGSFTQALVNGGANVSSLRKESIADIRAKLGVGETSTVTAVGRLTSGLANSISKANLSSVLPAIRTQGNLIEERLWDLPLYNILHVIRANKLKASDPTGFQERFPNLLADWQLRERTTRAVLSNLKFFGAIAPMLANALLPDEEKWFWYTGNYPVDPAGRAKFQKNRQELGWDAQMLIIGPLRIPMGRGVAERLLMPVTLARFVADAADEKGFTGVDLVNTTQSLAQTLVPGFSQLAGTFKKAETEGGIKSFVKDELIFKPLGFSGVFKDPRRILGDTVDVKASDAWVAWTNPFYTDQDLKGVVTLKNALGETVKEDANPFRWTADVGLPVSWQVEPKGRDPVKKQIFEDFTRIGYSGGRYNLNDFKEKLTAAGKEYTPDLWKRFNEARIREFQKNYVAERSTILKKKDPSASVGSVWSKATPKGYEAIGIKLKN